ncbi:terminase small subunit [Wansuia hejianensis]|uniref:Terminase small subunit n=1 Tax=Wansuia hejianensis TaxID=2763667 RepID=A0A7G9GB53_9FIRM|nr:terminase small subunit [Wansuia hejianensis]QNM08035.1 terminase small subunit [Wansuia hejianensis]RHV86986.1 hypothetical protein DXA96_14460 [Lachnospiraceae bacterium OF09-33XD]
MNRKTKLTDKQERFVQELLRGATQRDAYKAAYGCKNWKVSAIDAQASKLLKDPKVAERREALKQRAIDLAGQDAASVRALILETEIAIASADLGKVYELGRDKSGRLTAKIKDLDSLDTRAIQEIRFDPYGRPMIKLYDKQTAIRALKEYYGIEPQEQEQTKIEIELKKAEEADR